MTRSYFSNLLFVSVFNTEPRRANRLGNSLRLFIALTLRLKELNLEKLESFEVLIVVRRCRKKVCFEMVADRLGAKGR